MSIAIATAISSRNAVRLQRLRGMDSSLDSGRRVNEVECRDETVPPLQCLDRV
jgi:hypothetical protein